jgi:hypothetical protein
MLTTFPKHQHLIHVQELLDLGPDRRVLPLLAAANALQLWCAVVAAPALTSTKVRGPTKVGHRFIHSVFIFISIHHLGR